MDHLTQPLAAASEFLTANSMVKAVDDITGKTLGDFHILRRLGQGGMGQVYLAEQVSLKRKVAIKVLRKDLAANETSLQRFQAEARAIARVTHANIVQVYAVGEEGDLHYMALEYVEGRNLREHLEKKGPQEVLVSIGILRQVAAALQRASELGIIHRDVKPENILITRKGEVKVADFGLSRILAEDCQPLNLTASGVTMGTPLYMSPEQVEGKPVDARTDIYSLGVTAYHLLTGAPPFRGTSPFEVVEQHVRKEPVPLATVRPDLPPELCAMVHKMLAKRPEARYQTAQEIVRDLSRLRDVLVGVSATLPLVDMEALPATPSGVQLAAQAPAPSVRQANGLLLAAAFALMLLGGLGMGWYLSHNNQERAVASSADKPAPLPVVPAAPDRVKDEEEHLVWEFKQLAKADQKEEKMFEFHAAVKLGMFYLQHGQVDKAAKFFKELEVQDQQPTKYLGKLGDAMVLSFRDQPKKSNDLFRILLFRKPANKKAGPLVKGGQVLVNRQLREMTARCLQRNYVNDPKLFPPALHSFLEPPTPVIHDKKERKPS